MTIKTFFTIFSVLALVFGAGFVLAPDQVGRLLYVIAAPNVRVSLQAGMLTMAAEAGTTDIVVALYDNNKTLIDYHINNVTFIV